MIKVFEDMDMDWEGDVCKQLEGDSDFCGDWVACFTGDDPACAYEPCKDEIEAQSSCSDDSWAQKITQEESALIGIAEEQKQT